MNNFLHYALEKAELISFDVFDTLLLRSCGKPQNVFIAIEKESGRIGYAKARTSAEWKAIRKAAGTHQVSLDEIYACIPKYTDLKDRELQFERETAQANPEVLEIWNEAGRLGKKRVICSDMYLSARFVGELLNGIGISDWEAIYVSKDRNATKASGELFDVLINETGVVPSKILHIGDNAQSDIQQANRKGIVAFQYCRNVDSGIEKPFARNVPWSQIVENGWRKFGSNDYWDRIGYVYGGVLGYAYARFIGEESKRRGITRLLLVYRDGYQLEPILNLLYPEIKTSLIYAPRITSVLSTCDFSRDSTMRRQFVWHKVGMKGDSAERDQFISTGVLSPENKEALETQSAQAKRNYADYIATLKIEPNEQVALVDMTTGALTSTHLVEMTLGLEVTSFYLICYRPPLDNLPKHIVPYFHAHVPSAVFAWLSEFIYTGPTPTVREVRDNKPVYASPSIFDEFKIAICKKIRKAIIASAEELSKHDVTIARAELLDYFEQFHAAITARDESEFSFAREANNLDQNNFASPFHKELRQIHPRLKLFGRSVINVKTFIRGGGGYIQRFI